jgi:hypothetical protein
MLSKAILYNGTKQSCPRPLELRAGPLTLCFEPATAFLRHLRLGDQEAVRAIYAAVRDQNWTTVPPQVSNLKSDIAKDSFRLSFEVACEQGEILYTWRGLITGEASGRITYSFEGEARSDFLRNRIGICVLHPIAECAGRPCVIEHPDGSQEQGVFPRHISPYQPFEEIRGLSYEVAGGMRAQFRFHGEVFEMEDQRNWSDASFKTYCTPLRLALPAAVKKGDRVQQSVTLELLNQTRPVLAVNLGRAPQFSISTTPVTLKPQCQAMGPKCIAGQAFVTKLNALGQLVYSTFLGGDAGATSGEAIAVDADGRAYVTGWTYDPTYPTTPGALDPTCGSDGSCNGIPPNTKEDAFVAVLNPSGSGFAYSSFLGGHEDDEGTGIAVGAPGVIYLAGMTSSDGSLGAAAAFPTTAAAWNATLQGTLDDLERRRKEGELVPVALGFPRKRDGILSGFHGFLLAGGRVTHSDHRS